MKINDLNCKRAKIYKKCLVVSMVIGCIMVVITGKQFVDENIPQDVFSKSQIDEMIDLEDENIVENANAQIKVKNVKIYACGMPVGLYLQTNGVMVIDCASFQDENGKTVTPLKNKVQQGDYIEKFNGTEVENKSQLINLIKENKNKKVNLEIVRDGENVSIDVTPVKDKNGEYKIGIWVRDDTQGLGTITFVTSDGRFGALGHGISDLDTGDMVSSYSGKLYKATIWGIKKGKEGEPGGFCGSIDYKDENIIGNITNNTDTGLFGNLDTEKIKLTELTETSIADKKEIDCGEAKVLLYIDGEYNEYNINIKKIRKNAKQNKNLVIEITDERLLKKTNGIIQGMSGAPILQNGKLIGAVTHVFVNEPHNGYATFIENMIECE